MLMSMIIIIIKNGAGNMGKAQDYALSKDRPSPHPPEPQKRRDGQAKKKLFVTHLNIEALTNVKMHDLILGTR